MKGRKIVIKGDAGNIIGEKMKGGEIIIEGNAGFWIGERAKGGKIMVGKKLYSFSNY